MTSPAAAQSSLSHCRTLRPGMRAHSTGHTSITGRSQITMPPEWMPRWRGKSEHLAGQLQHQRRQGVAVGQASWLAAGRRPWTRRPTCLGACPRALPMSRMAERAR